jgi:predicted lipase
MILSAVEIALSRLGVPSVTVVGHSLGGALALLDGIYFRLHFRRNVSVRVITYGMPRVGNRAFAGFVDRTLTGLVTHVNNREDWIPTVPGIIFGYHHPSGEIHIQDSGTWDACPGAFFFLPALACGSVDRAMSDICAILSRSR